VTDRYEFGVDGRVGPTLRACIPELTLVSDTACTLLTGTVPGPRGLQRILSILAANGLEAIDLRLQEPDRGD
jgi:hypothetical protein